MSEKINTIEIEVDKTLSALSGNQYGVSLFQTQVKDKLVENEKNIIVIPNQIEDVAASFIQGFFKGIVDVIGIEKFNEYVLIQAGDKDIVDKIYDNIY